MQITPEQIHWLGGALVAALSVIVTAIGFLVRQAYKLGRDAEKVGTALQLVTEWKAAIAEIPVIKQRVGALEGMTTQIVSDIRELLRERRGSRPDPEEANGHAEE